MFDICQRSWPSTRNVIPPHFKKTGRYGLGMVELCAKILQIMSTRVEDYAQSFCQLSVHYVRHFLGYLLHIFLT